MSALVMLSMTIVVPLVALGLYDVQHRLERWDYNRHAED